MKQELSIAIITRDREPQLAQCLRSILDQNWNHPLPPMSIVNTSRHQLSVKLKQLLMRLPNFQLFHLPLQTVAAARNLAIEHCITSHVLFVDDDCELAPNYFEQVERTHILDDTQSMYFLGDAVLASGCSFAAQAEQVYNDFWTKRNQQRYSGSISPFRFDTKNAILNCQDFKRLNMFFSKHFQRERFDSSDTAMGFMLAENDIRGSHVPSLLVIHHDGVHLFSLLRKQFYKGLLAKKIVEQFELKNEFVDFHFSFTKLISWRREYHEFFVDQPAYWPSRLLRIYLFILIKLRVWTFSAGYWLATKL